MFNDIAPKYDFLNHFLSLGIDRYWRRLVIAELNRSKPVNILDVATGTADLAILEAKKLKNSKIAGIDIASTMLSIGQKKVIRQGLTSQISLQYADGQNLPFDNDYFDATSIAFGLRNFENPARGIHEMFRVLKPGGKALILEFSTSRNRFFGFLFDFYFGKMLPAIGKWVSGHSRAYTYLPESVKEFNQKYNLTEVMRTEGFSDIKAKTLTFGVATLYIGTKNV